MRAQRIKRSFFRLGVGLALLCALLALFNLFDNNPRAARNAVELLGMGVGLFLAARVLGWLTAKFFTNDGKISN
jgi:hypothetical protein